MWELLKQDAHFLTHTGFSPSKGSRARPVLVIRIHPKADYARKEHFMKYLIWLNFEISDCVRFGYFFFFLHNNFKKLHSNCKNKFIVWNAKLFRSRKPSQTAQVYFCPFFFFFEIICWLFSRKNSCQSAPRNTVAIGKRFVIYISRAFFFHLHNSKMT